MRFEEKFRELPQENPDDVKVFIAFLRLLRSWTQADLAAALGLTAGSISRYETGDVLPDRETLEDIALAVGLPLRMLDRVLLTVSAARTAMASAADPTHLDRRVAAITRDLAAGLFDLASLAAASVLADLPELDLGPWAKSALSPYPEDWEEEPEPESD